MLNASTAAAAAPVFAMIFYTIYDTSWSMAIDYWLLSQSHTFFALIWFEFVKWFSFIVHIISRLILVWFWFPMFKNALATCFAITPIAFAFTHTHTQSFGYTLYVCYFSTRKTSTTTLANDVWAYWKRQYLLIKHYTHFTIPFSQFAANGSVYRLLLQSVKPFCLLVILILEFECSGPTSNEILKVLYPSKEHFISKSYTYWIPLEIKQCFHNKKFYTRIPL